MLYYYNYIQTEIQKSPYLHIDETGWRVFGKNFWLWSFSNKQLVFFTINKTRGSTVIKELLGEFFIFIDFDIPKDNNHSERTLRNAALFRKTSFGSQSVKGADMTAIFLTVFATLKLNGINPVDFLIGALKNYIVTGCLPDFPLKNLSID